MPLTRKSAGEWKPHPPQEQQEAGPSAKRPRLEAAEPETTDPGRPHQAFVERRLREFLRDNNIHALVKPTQDEIRAAALPILCQALRNRRGNRQHRAVDAVQLHARGRGWITPPYSRLLASPGYIDALIQLADDAGWLAREIPLPDHLPPRHPTIYYTIDPQSNRPVPRADSYIRGEYVYQQNGSRVTRDRYIYPWTDTTNFPGKTRLIASGWDACYSLVYDPRIKNVAVQIDWLSPWGNYISYDISPLADFIFSPHPPP